MFKGVNGVLIKTENYSFLDRLDHYVVNQVSKGSDTFGDLLGKFPGLYPAALFDSLKRLESSGRISQKILLNANTRSITNDPQAQWAQIVTCDMPTPHPLDFDWRFTPETAHRLQQICLELSGPDDLIACLGCPTVFNMGIKKKHQRRFALFDKNRTYSRWSRSDQLSICTDLMSASIPQLQARATLADPPWYLRYEQAFLQAASRVTKLGGFILITSPSLWTKSDVQRDWTSLLEWSKDLGLGHLTTLPGTLRYDSPYFERNSLRAAGLDFAPTNWRLGDLVLFRKVANPASMENVVVQSGYSEWLEESHFGFRIRNPGFGSDVRFRDPSLISLVPGDVLPSVSRADPSRSLADVWTEGNRIFACRGPHILQRILAALEEGKLVMEHVCSTISPPLATSQRRLMHHAIQQVVNIINIERTERNRFEKS